MYSLREHFEKVVTPWVHHLMLEIPSIEISAKTSFRNFPEEMRWITYECPKICGCSSEFFRISLQQFCRILVGWENWTYRTKRGSYSKSKIQEGHEDEILHNFTVISKKSVQYRNWELIQWFAELLLKIRRDYAKMAWSSLNISQTSHSKIHQSPS